jgi:hypothetical protein
MVTNGKVRVVRFVSKALVGAQLNWSVREMKCYGIFYGVRLFEDLLDNRPFILKTDHKNLTYLNVTLTGKILRWKLYLQDKVFYLCHVPGKEVHQGVPDALPRLCENYMPKKPVQAGKQPFNQSSRYQTRSMTRLQRLTIPARAIGAMFDTQAPQRSCDY